jgi:hypothetical protein
MENGKHQQAASEHDQQQEDPENRQNPATDFVFHDFLEFMKAYVASKEAFCSVFRPFESSEAGHELHQKGFGVKFLDVRHEKSELAGPGNVAPRQRHRA